MAAGFQRGKLYVIEGGDGTGKQTQSNLLVTALLRRGEKAQYEEEPTSSGLGLSIKKDLEQEGEHLDARTLQLLFTADRSDHVARKIAPALDKGINVVADRYYPSTFAYAIAAGLPTNEVDAVINANMAFPKPHRVMILDLPPAVAAKRMEARGRTIDRHEKDLRFQVKVRDAYHGLARRFGQKEGWFVVSADGTPDAVHERIMALVD